MRAPARRWHTVQGGSRVFRACLTRLAASLDEPRPRPLLSVIKYYAWENNFSAAINDVRRKEVEVLTSQAYWR